MEVSGQLYAPAALPPGKEDLVPIGGWVGPTAVLDAVAKGKIPSPRRESNPRTSIVQPVHNSSLFPLFLFPSFFLAFQKKII
jgi:hypothetical protein